MRSLMSVVDRSIYAARRSSSRRCWSRCRHDASRDLGVNWIVDGSGDNFLVGLFNQPIAGVSLGDIARGDPGSVLGHLRTRRIHRRRRTQPGQRHQLRRDPARARQQWRHQRRLDALGHHARQRGGADQGRAGSAVPDRPVHEYGGRAGGAVNPFQTIERKEVGNILKITPQITDENTILLKIEQEASGIAAAAAQVSTTDLVTNKRTISTRVLVDDGGMIVLGGLIEDRLTESERPRAVARQASRSSAPCSACEALRRRRPTSWSSSGRACSDCRTGCASRPTPSTTTCATCSSIATMAR